VRKTKRRKIARLKTKLGLPNLEQAKSTVLASLRSRESQRSCRHAIDEFALWYCSEPRLSFNKTVVTCYGIHLADPQLAPGTVNVRLAVVRRLAYEAADTGLLSPELAAGTTGRWHLHTCDDDLDLGRAAVDEEFDAVDET
jgi:hypothetical protein